YGMALDKRNPMTIYVASSSGLFRSDTGGATFARMNYPVSYCQTLLVAPSDSNALYASPGSTPTIFVRSSDRGMNWFAVDALLPRVSYLLLAIDPTDPKGAYASTG